MENTALWVTIAVYIIAMMVIGIYSGRKSKSIADFTTRFLAPGSRGGCLRAERAMFPLG